MDEAKQDRRVRKTKQNLFDALTSLMAEKRYPMITIQEIIDRADVGRSTFYAHFETKDDLLFSQTVGYLDHLNHFIRNLMDQSNEQGSLVSIEGLFEHIFENEKIIKSFFVADGMEPFRQKATGYWQETIKGFLDERRDPLNKRQIPTEILANHIAKSLINMLDICLTSKHKYTAKELDLYFKQLINPVLESYLG